MLNGFVGSTWKYHFTRTRKINKVSQPFSSMLQGDNDARLILGFLSSCESWDWASGLEVWGCPPDIVTVGFFISIQGISWAYKAVSLLVICPFPMADNVSSGTAVAPDIHQAPKNFFSCPTPWHLEGGTSSLLLISKSQPALAVCPTYLHRSGCHLCTDSQGHLLAPLQYPGVWPGHSVQPGGNICSLVSTD